MYVDVHSHIVPSGDDGAPDVEKGLELCREAVRHGTRVLYATPHVWPHLVLTEERERSVRAAYAEMAPRAAGWGLELRLAFEVTPAAALLDQDLTAYAASELGTVLIDLPVSGPLDLAELVAKRVEDCGLTPLLAHPERADGVIADPFVAAEYRDLGWLLQVNASSLLGRHGTEREETGWFLVERGLATVVGSDGHRLTRPPYLDEAHERVRARLGDRADALFDGTNLGSAHVAGAGFARPRSAATPDAPASR